MPKHRSEDMVRWLLAVIFAKRGTRNKADEPVSRQHEGIDTENDNNGSMQSAAHDHKYGAATKHCFRQQTIATQLNGFGLLLPLASPSAYFAERMEPGQG